MDGVCKGALGTYVAECELPDKHLHPPPYSILIKLNFFRFKAYIQQTIRPNTPHRSPLHI